MRIPEYSDLDQLERPCRDGDRYACRVLVAWGTRVHTPWDCIIGNAPVAFCPLFHEDRERARPLLIDGCRHGVLLDCHAVNVNRRANDMDLLSDEIYCYFGGVCGRLALHALAHRDPQMARYYLEFQCRVYGSCDLLAAAYRGRYLRELEPGRLRALSKITPAPWTYEDLRRARPADAN